MRHMIALFVCFFMFILATGCMKATHDCPPGTYWDSEQGVCVEKERQVSESPQDFSNNLDKAVQQAIKCVKDNNNQFNQAFARLIEIAKKNPKIKNADKIKSFVRAVAVDAPYVPRDKAIKKWNRYFVPYYFVSASYKYKSIQTYCDEKQSIKHQVNQELKDKEIGLLECMANPSNKDKVQSWYQQAKATARSLKDGIDAACKACGEKSGVF